MGAAFAGIGASADRMFGAGCTYLTLFVAASVLIGDFITLVYNLLGGELTTRFMLKVLTIAVIAGTIFFYYLPDLRLEDTKPIVERTASGRLIGTVSLAAVTAVVITGLVWTRAHRPASEFVGSTRDGLTTCSAFRAVPDIFWGRHTRLPPSIAGLESEGGSGCERPGPVGRAVWISGHHGDRTYELCATFTTDSAAAQNPAYPGFWSHRAGRQCFQLEVKETR